MNDIEIVRAARLENRLTSVDFIVVYTKLISKKFHILYFQGFYTFLSRLPQLYHKLWIIKIILYEIYTFVTSKLKCPKI